jgi:hypothetical protein
VHQGARDHQTAFHTAGEFARRATPFLPQPYALEALLGRDPRASSLDPVIARLIDNNLKDRFEHVEVEFLRHEPEVRACFGEFGIDVLAEDEHLSAGLVDQ